MNFDEIMMLVKAGYTKEEISAMQTPADPAPADPAPAPAGNDQILAALNQLTQAVITNNINRQAFYTTPQRTAEEALAEIIAPPSAPRNRLGGK